jgi:hypothetical protein
MGNLDESDREIVAMLLDTKAVDFEAIGRTIGAHGSKFIGEDDGWIRFCGSDLRGLQVAPAESGTRAAECSA